MVFRELGLFGGFYVLVVLVFELVLFTCIWVGVWVFWVWGFGKLVFSDLGCTVWIDGGGL